MMPCVEELVVALQRRVAPRRAGAVARHLALGLRELHLERPRIDLGQQIALLDRLPFA